MHTHTLRIATRHVPEAGAVCGSRTYGSVRGLAGNCHPYRDHAVEGFGHFRPGPSPVALDPSSGEQEFTRIKDVRPSPRRQPTGSRDGLGKTCFGGFFVGGGKVLGHPGSCARYLLLAQALTMFLEIFTATNLQTDLLALGPNERPLHTQFATAPVVEQQNARQREK
jgi:hypothetical protein